MKPTELYLAILLIVLAVVASLLFMRRRTERSATRLTRLAYLFVLAGILFGENHLLSYILLGLVVILALADAFVHLRGSPRGV